MKCLIELQTLIQGILGPKMTCLSAARYETTSIYQKYDLGSGR